MYRVTASRSRNLRAGLASAIWWRMYRRLIPVLCLGLLVLAPPVRGEAVLKLAATVNGDPITVHDLVHRMRLVFLTSHLRDTPETRQRLTSQVLRNLIDEALQLQEAKRLKITVSDEELNTLLAKLNKQNGMSPGGIERMLEQNRIDLAALRAKIRAEQAWMGVIRQQIRRQVLINGEDVDEELARLRLVRHLPRHRVAEIFLPADGISNDAQVRDLANRLMQQLRAGAKFSALAQEFSQSASAAVGGDLGWVTQGQLDAELEREIETLRPGQIAGPIRTLAGFYILLLLEKSEGSKQAADKSTVDYVQLDLPVAPDADADQRARALSFASEIRDGITGCEAMRDISPAYPTAVKTDGKSVPLNSMPIEIRKSVAMLKRGETSEPIPVEKGITLVTVCDRKDDDTGLPSREEIRQRLGDRRLNMLIQRYMRELRRTAIVDVRV